MVKIPRWMRAVRRCGAIGVKIEPKSFGFHKGNTVSLCSFPKKLGRIFRKKSLMGMQVKECGESERLFVMRGIEVETLLHAKAGRLPRGLF